MSPMHRTFAGRRAACRRLGATLALAASTALTMPARAAGADAAPRVRFETSAGDIVLELDAKAAPKTVANFIGYVKAGHYDGTVFHRVIDGFMIQGGGYDAKMVERPTREPIPLEARNGLQNVRGSIAMARTADPHSATAQFFINVVDNARLDAANARDGHGYAVFGRVVQGMEAVDRIRQVSTAERGEHRNVPVEPVVLRKAVLLP